MNKTAVEPDHHHFTAKLPAWFIVKLNETLLQKYTTLLEKIKIAQPLTKFLAPYGTKIQYHIYQSPPQGFMLIKINPVRILSFYSSKIRLNIVLFIYV